MALYRGSTLITDFRIGGTPILEIRRGSALVWSRSTKRDDFNRADAATLGANWTDIGPSTDYKLGIENGAARVRIPDGLIGGFFDYRTSAARFNAGVAAADDGFIEARMATRGDGYSVTSLSGFTSQLWGRGNNTGGTLTSGVGIDMTAGHTWIIRRVSGVDARMADGGTFQAGDRLRLTYTGNLHVLFNNGREVARWNDSGATVPKDASHRSMVAGGAGGKDALGPRRFSPAFDYVLMG